MITDVAPSAVRERRLRHLGLVLGTALAAYAIRLQAAGSWWYVAPSTRLATVAIGLVSGMLLLGAGAPRGRPRGSSAAGWLLLAMTVAFLGSQIARGVAQGEHTWIQDEPIYLLASHLLAEPQLGRGVAPDDRPFFAVAFTTIHAGRLRTQFPPGWPALLALFRWVHLGRESGGLLLCVGVAFTFLLGRHVHSTLAGLIAAALLATSPIVLRYSGTYMAHAAALACVVPAAWLLLRTEAPGARRTKLSWVGAGALLGMAFAIRPLTAASLGSSLAIWLLVRRRLPRRALLCAAGLVGLGALPFLLATFYFNAVTNGSPLVFGYSAVEGHLHDLGFGPRGWVQYDLVGQPYQTVDDFNVRVAVRHTWHTGWRLVYLMMPMPLLLTVVAAAAYFRLRVRWGVLLAFFALPAAHFAYFYSEPRFYIELLPFLFIAVGVLLAEMAVREQWAPHLLLGLGLLGNAYVTYHYVPRTSSRLLGLFSEIERQRHAHPKLLLFVESGALFEQLYEFNAASFRGPVVVARDLGSRNAELAQRYPEYEAMRVTAATGDKRFRIWPYQTPPGLTYGSHAIGIPRPLGTRLLKRSAAASGG